MIRIVFNGCNGRMGRAVSEICKNSDEYEIVAGCDAFNQEQLFDYPVYEKLDLITEEFDSIIDFSNAKAVSEVLEFAVKRVKPVVCCTTGLDDETLETINKDSEIIPIFKSANMSLGMNVLFELVKSATDMLYPDCEIEIIEAHHNKKLDAPSGTAYMIADVISEATNNELKYVYDRHDVRQKRDHNELGISSIRGGNIVGEHETMFIMDEEIVKISHSASDRTVFGRGALNAAKYLVGKKPGLYSMKNLTTELLAQKKNK